MTNTKKQLQLFIHNFVIHPLCACLPTDLAEKIHKSHVKTIYHYDGYGTTSLNDKYYSLFSYTRDEMIQQFNDDIDTQFPKDDCHHVNDDAHSLLIDEYVDFIYTLMNNEIEFSYETDFFLAELRAWLEENHPQLKLGNI